MLFHFLTLTDPQRERQISERSRSAREREREAPGMDRRGARERERERCRMELDVNMPFLLSFLQRQIYESFQFCFRRCKEFSFLTNFSMSWIVSFKNKSLSWIYKFIFLSSFCFGVKHF